MRQKNFCLIFMIINVFNKSIFLFVDNFLAVLYKNTFCIFVYTLACEVVYWSICCFYTNKKFKLTSNPND